MTWKVRHEGSPSFVDGLTPAQVIEGLHDGHWETTDEVQGPDEPDWLPIEAHPVFEEAAAEVEPPPPRPHDDEANLDMNPLIDVCLVLLVFFVLTTSYAAMQKRIEAPTVSAEKAKVAVFTKEQVAETMLHVVAKMEDGAPVVRLEGKVVTLPTLAADLRKFARGTGKSTLLLEHDDAVPQDVVVKVIDAAKAAGLDRIRLLVP